MTTEQGTDRLGADARAIVDSNAYMTLATADALGTPWASPVWFAHDGYIDFLWMSRPEARHSRNIALRREIAIVIFDSSVSVGGAQAVYVEATAQEVGEPDIERSIEICSRRSLAHGAEAWGIADVTAGAPHRVYRARASAHFILGRGDQRLAVDLTL